MKTTIERVEAGRILPADPPARLGPRPRRMLRVVVETLDDADAEVAADDLAGRTDDAIMEIVDEEVATCRRAKRD